MNEVLQEKEQKCTSVFNEIARICYQFNKGDYLSSSLSQKITEFDGILKDWDNYVQPLQVNMQRRGGQHDSSSALVHMIRNRIINLCNQSQETLAKMLSNLSHDNLLTSQYVDFDARWEAKEKLPQKLSDSVIFTREIIRLIDLLITVFAELEITAEQLKKDKKDLTELYDTLLDLYKQVQEAKRQANSHKIYIPYSSNSGGCYIATCVYGSYDCPEVWTLRRYRDKTLGTTWYGRLFIRLYYAISPTIVKWFGGTKLFKKIWKIILDKKVKHLQNKGFEDTPYNDIDWNKKH